MVFAPAGSPIFMEGDPGTGMYILLDGTVTMYRRRDGNNVPLATYVAKSDRPWFGELSLWQSKPRAASAIPAEFSKLLKLPSANFSTFLQICPAFSQMFSISANAFNAINKIVASKLTDICDKTVMHGLDNTR